MNLNILTNDELVVAAEQSDSALARELAARLDEAADDMTELRDERDAARLEADDLERTVNRMEDLLGQALLPLRWLYGEGYGYGETKKLIHFIELELDGEQR